MPDPSQTSEPARDPRLPRRAEARRVLRRHPGHEDTARRQAPRWLRVLTAVVIVLVLAGMTVSTVMESHPEADVTGTEADVITPAGPMQLEAEEPR